MTHLHSKFQLKMSIYDRDNERKLKIIGIFLCLRGITLLKIIQPKSKSYLPCIFPWHITILNFMKMSRYDRDNERKLKIIIIILSLRGITVPKIIQPNPNSNLTWVFSWNIHIQNLNSKYTHEQWKSNTQMYNIISRIYWIYFQRISGDFMNTKDRHDIVFISSNMKCPNVHTHVHFPTVV